MPSFSRIECSSSTDDCDYAIDRAVRSWTHDEDTGPDGVHNGPCVNLHGPEIDMVESSRHDRHDRSLYGRGESLPEIGYDYIGRSVVFWYNEGQGIEDPFRVIKIVRRDASNEQLIEQIISEIGCNPGSMPEGIGRIHDAGGARAIGGADNGVDAVASWKDKGDDRTDVPSYGKDGVISEQVGNNKIVHSMPVGWNGLIFKEKFRKSDFIKFKTVV